jgi:hypothetical protein
METETTVFFKILYQEKLDTYVSQPLLQNV